MPEIREVTLYCILYLENTDLDIKNLYVKSFLNSDATLDAICKFRLIDSITYLDSFIRKLYVTLGHPLYDFGVPVSFKNNSLKIK